MIAKIVQTAKQTVKAIVLSHRARLLVGLADALERVHGFPRSTEHSGRDPARIGGR
jgi:hypothetical protein